VPAFDYAAIDAQGRTRHGAVEAGNLRDARALLRQRALVPVRIEPAAAKAQRAGLLERFGKRELALFTRQLATLVAATPLEEALRTIGAQSDRRAVRRTIGAVHAQLLEGFSLADVMARQGKAFPPLYRAMVAAGERSGALPEILERLAGLLETEQQVRGKLLTMLAYPAALAATAVAVVVALMTFVVPKVVEQFDSMGRTLPWLTRAVIGTSEAIQHWGLPLLALLALAAVAARALLARPHLRLRFDAALLRAPLLGRLIRDTHAARIARTLAIMVGSGLPLMEGLRITAPTVRNRALRDATERMADAIREGGSLSAAMKRAGVFPPTLVYMATSGENSGRLAPMLDRAADYLEREFATFAAVLMSLLEPAIIVALGGVVALIVLSILLPILQFNSLALAR
jgi:general secretion pathway protein F